MKPVKDLENILSHWDLPVEVSIHGFEAFLVNMTHPATIFAHGPVEIVELNRPIFEQVAQTPATDVGKA